MHVTKIQQQVKRPDRYSVYIDGKYTFSLSDYQLVSLKIKVGAEYSAGELEQLMQDSQFGKAYERALNYVMIRPRSEKEIRDYLVRTFIYPRPKVFTNKKGERVIKKQTVDKQKTSLMIDRVMKRLSEKGYIDDARFARLWVASRQLTKKSSKRKLQQELLTKGIALEIIATALQNETVDEKQNLADLVAKKRRLARYQDSTQLTQYLLRQGFNYDDIKEAVEV